MKNVYSVYRYNPSAIGFAALSGSANTVSTGTVANTTTNGGTTGTGSGNPTSAGSRTAVGLVAVLFTAALSALASVL